jgi:hypothetical protein
LAAASNPEGRTAVRKSKGMITSEQLTATKAELHRQAQQLEIDKEAHAEKLAAASLAEQLQAVRQEKRQEGAERGESLPAHRPSTYTEEEATALCQWIAEGRSLRSWCTTAGRQPFTVYSWLRERPDFAHRYALAHEDRTDSLADEILEIADSVAGTESIAAVQAARLQVEARKWIASKLRPTKYGDKQIVEQQGNVTFNLAVGRQATAVPTLDADAAGNPLIVNGNS